VAFIAIVGLAIDLGLVYIERVRIARAVDAAALAGVHELPNEVAAHLRAQAYLERNGYDRASTLFERYGPLDSVVITGNLTSDSVFYINTTDWELHEDPEDPLSPKIANSAYRIEVGGTVPVRMNFMRLLGFGTIDVSSDAVAESVNSLDVIVVLDDSGSMNYDTVCHGCYEPTDDPYPAGDRYPLSFPNVLCDTDSPPQGYTEEDGEYYITIEAEHYTLYTVDYHGVYKDKTTSYWAMQRNGGSNTSGEGAGGRRPYMRHHRWNTNNGDVDTSRSWADVQNLGTRDYVPRLDYTFYVPDDGVWFMWVRGQGGSDDRQAMDPGAFHWGLDGEPEGGNLEFPIDGGGVTPSNARWRWVRLGVGRNWTVDSVHTLNIWAGGMGVNLDKIVITTDTDDPPALLDDDSIGPVESGRLYGLACNECTVPYGNGVADGCSWDTLNDVMFGGEQPIRTAKEAIKNFAGKLDPQYDQFGFVRYDTNASIGNELECLVRLGQNDCADDYETAYIDVLAAVSGADVGGSTNISEAMWDGLRVLMTRAEGAPDYSDPGNLFADEDLVHYGRPQANHIMILVTDGRVNQRAGDKCNDGAFRTAVASKFGKDSFGDFWPDNGDSDYDCVMVFAYLARNNLVTLYTIGIGDSVDDDLLAEAARVTGGIYKNAPSRDQLDDIFTEIFDRIYVRLIR